MRRALGPRAVAAPTKQCEESAGRLFKIGQVARLLGLTTQALRFYEQNHIVNPVRSENGTRYYAMQDIMVLLVIHKCRNVDFSLQNILEFTISRPLEERVRILDSKVETLVEQGSELLRRAQDLKAYTDHAKEALSGVGKLQPCMRPEFVVQKFVLDELEKWSDKQFEYMQNYNFSQMTMHGFLTNADRIETARYRYCVESKWANFFSLPIEETLCLPSVSCVSTYFTCPAVYSEEDVLHSIIQQIEADGYTINQKEPILCLLVDLTISNIIEKVYIPIK